MVDPREELYREVQDVMSVTGDDWAIVALLAKARAEADMWRRDAIALRSKHGLSTCTTKPGCKSCPDCHSEWSDRTIGE